jgi:peptide/nickel transport system permease protein
MKLYRISSVRPGTVVSAGILAFWLVVAVFGSFLLPHDPTDFIADDAFADAAGALLGTDHMGRDIASRLLAGTQLTIGMSVAAAALAHLIGVTLGIFAAVKGGWIDAVSSRFVDVILSVPKIIVGLVVVAVLGPSLSVIVIMTGSVYSGGVFRIARALARDIVVQDYIKAATARGEGTFHVMVREILPNIVGPLAVDFALRVSFAILFISSLGFLGLGVQPPKADWGTLVHDNISGLAAGSLAAIWPALAIASVTISLNYLVDTLSIAGEHGRKP